MEILGICLGIGLAAAAGFRVFVPLLVLSAAAKMGLVSVVPGFEWVGSDIALIAFGVATVVEIGAYYVPWIDNALDTIATPLAVVAGVFLTAAVFTDVSPIVRWVTAIIAGGGTAGAIGLTTSVTRAASSATTGGLTNWMIATAENIGSTVMAVLSVVVPVAGVIALGVLVYLVYRRISGRVDRASWRVPYSRRS